MLLLILLVATLSGLRGEESLTAIRDCKLIPTEWADGDSFLVESPDGQQFTVRLYAVDCIETRIADQGDASRLRTQRRYFGIMDAGGSPQESLQIARTLGNKAAAEVRKNLSKPFTVHTSFADARGDHRYKRVYAFVTTADGKDLGEHLVRKGLARAFGAYRSTPSGEGSSEYREKMRDLEFRAAKLGLGIWALTDWEKLPEERRVLRKEDAELAIAQRPAGASSPVDLNAASRDELISLPGVGEVIAQRIIEARPYQETADLLRIQGMSPKKLEALKALVTVNPPAPPRGN